MATTSATVQQPPRPRSKYHERSYELLDAARAAAFKKRRYDSEATRAALTQECLKRVGFVPYAEQLDLAECMLLGLDAVAIAGTGWGKTLPFVLPLFIPDTKGKIIVIISPLNALEMDQADRFRKMGLTAVALNGETNTPDLLLDIERGKHAVIVVGPKLLVAQGGAVRALFSKPSFTGKVLGMVVDEAHCITQWGSGFRPEYADIGTIRALLPVTASVQLVSATMPPPVLEQACKTVHVNLERSFVLHLGNDRRNIMWEVIYMTAGKSDLECLAFLIPPQKATLTHLPKTMIFFDDIMQAMRAWRWLTEHLPKNLRSRVKCYHSRRCALGKALTMRSFQRGCVDFLCTTEAAGMGCDIPDIVHVVQYMAPESLSVWVQRAGRAGRRPDIQARATLLIQPTVFYEKGKRSRKEGEAVTYVKEIKFGLREWVETPEDQCRRDVADRYFDNPPGRAVPTGKCCDNCTAREQIPDGAAPCSAAELSCPMPMDARTTRREAAAPLATAPGKQYAPENWRAFLPVNRPELAVAKARETLEKWRTEIWRTHYSHQPFGPKAILPDPLLTTLATRTTFRTLEDLAEVKWLFSKRHGAEVLAVLEPLDREIGLARLNEEKAKYDTAAKAKALKERERREREEHRAREKQEREEQRAREKQEREAERERERLRKAAQSALKKQAAEEAKRQKAEEKARMVLEKAYKTAAKAAAKVAGLKLRSMGSRVSRKRTAGQAEGDEESQCARPSKRPRANKENVPPQGGGHSAAVSPSGASVQTPAAAPRR